MEPVKIYRLYNDRGQCYYGCTTKTLKRRLGQHRTSAKTQACTSHLLFEPSCDLEEPVVNIELVEELGRCNCHKKREAYYIENNECVNKYVPGRTHKESIQAYLKKYPERRRQTQENWRKKNPTYHRDYYRRKRDEAKAQAEADEEAPQVYSEPPVEEVYDIAEWFNSVCNKGVYVKLE